ncbi:hypothetical protein C5167_046571 [Papaver somniferum]|uniref:Uncharacterized protein n=1 Tax=Papaver somniferum TaxID=3469 RepID=A0A4Y7LE64_PAPSO|nr:hypothetical protein C5167_046571 [Papaver somniferum]
MDEIQALAMMYGSTDDGQDDDSKSLVNVVVEIHRDPLDFLAHNMKINEVTLGPFGRRVGETTFFWLRHTRFVIMDNNTLAFTRLTIPPEVVSDVDEDDEDSYRKEFDARERACHRANLPIAHQQLEAEGGFKISYLRFKTQGEFAAVCNAITAASANASTQITIMHLGDHHTPQGLVDNPRDYQLLTEEVYF